LRNTCTAVELQGRNVALQTCSLILSTRCVIQQNGLFYLQLFLAVLFCLIEQVQAATTNKNTRSPRRPSPRKVKS